MEPMTAWEALTGVITGVALADPADTAAVLRQAWRGFLVADGLARSLAEHGGWAGESPGLADRVRLALDMLAGPLCQAPSLPPSLPGPDLQIAIDDVAGARSHILILALMLNTVLPEAAEHAGHPGDRAALYGTAAGARNLACCYDERLRPGLTEAAACIATETAWRRGIGA